MSDEDKERANIMSTWIEVLEEDISTQRINLNIVRLSNPDTVYNLYKIRIYYHKDRSAKNDFRMLKEKLHRIDIFEELASKVPKENIPEEPPLVEMNGNEMALPAFEMKMGIYDFRNFRTVESKTPEEPSLVEMNEKEMALPAFEMKMRIYDFRNFRTVESNTPEEPPLVEMNGKEMALPAFEMKMRIYDFGNFRTVESNTPEEPPLVEMNGKEMALLAFKMKMEIYDLGNFRTVESMISHRKGARIEEISDDLE